MGYESKLEFSIAYSVTTLSISKAIEHAEVHFNLVCSVDPRRLRLTDSDERMYNEFKDTFQDFQLSPLAVSQLKADDAKEKWRKFIKEFENVADFSYATLLRLDAGLDYSESNTIVVPRVQFLVIEVARNREGFNDNLRVKFPPEKKREA